MRYSSGVRFSRAKPTGTYRVRQPSSRAVASHSDSLREARGDAEYWIKAGAKLMEIQERFPSGKWVTVETVGRESAPLGKRSHATMKRKVHNYASGDQLSGRPSAELIKESQAEGPTGAVPAYRDAKGIWQYVQPSQEDFYRRIRGEDVITVWVE